MADKQKIQGRAIPTIFYDASYIYDKAHKGNPRYIYTFQQLYELTPSKALTIKHIYIYERPEKIEQKKYYKKVIKNFLLCCNVLTLDIRCPLNNDIWLQDIFIKNMCNFKNFILFYDVGFPYGEFFKFNKNVLIIHSSTTFQESYCTDISPCLKKKCYKCFTQYKMKKMNIKYLNLHASHEYDYVINSLNIGIKQLIHQFKYFGDDFLEEDEHASINNKPVCEERSVNYNFSLNKITVSFCHNLGTNPPKKHIKFPYGCLLRYNYHSKE